MSKHKAYIVASNGKVECVVLVTSFIHEGQAEADITVSKTFAGQGQEQVRKELIELNWAVFCPWIIWSLKTTNQGGTMKVVLPLFNDMKYQIDYKDKTERDAVKDALWYNPRAFKKLVKLTRQGKLNLFSFQLGCAFSGIQGYPVRCMWNRYGKTPWQEMP